MIVTFYNHYQSLKGSTNIRCLTRLSYKEGCYSPLTKPDTKTLDETNLRATLTTLVRRYRDYGYHDYASNNPPGTSIPVIYNRMTPTTFLACPTMQVAIWQQEMARITNTCTLAYFEGYAYHKTNKKGQTLWQKRI